MGEISVFHLHNAETVGPLKHFLGKINPTKLFDVV